MCGRPSQRLYCLNSLGRSTLFGQHRGIIVDSMLIRLKFQNLQLLSYLLKQIEPVQNGYVKSEGRKKAVKGGKRQNRGSYFSAFLNDCHTVLYQFAMVMTSALVDTNPHFLRLLFKVFHNFCTTNQRPNHPTSRPIIHTRIQPSHDFTRLSSIHQKINPPSSFSRGSNSSPGVLAALFVR